MLNKSSQKSLTTIMGNLSHIAYCVAITMISLTCSGCINADTKQFMPHGFCLQWDPTLVSIIVLSNLGIAIAYFAIPAALWYFVRRKKNLPYPWMFRLFGMFIVACGITHLMKIWTLYQPYYWLEVIADSCTAGISLLTAFLLWPLIPKALALKSPDELEEANAKLQESEERFRLLVSGVKDYAIFLLDPNGVIKTWNEGAQQIKGYDAEEAIGQHFSIFYPKEHREQNIPEKELKTAIETGRFENETVRLRKNGSEFLANVIIVPIYSKTGELTGFAKVIRDITEQKQYTDKLQEQADLLNSIHDAIIVRLFDGTITYWNRGAEIMYGFTEEEALGKLSHDLLKTEFPIPLEEIEKIILARGHWEGELIHDTRDNRRITVLARKTLKVDSLGNPAAIVAVNTDISMHKEAEQRQTALSEMKRVNIELEQFTSIASHDLQEPLRAIAGCLQIIEKTHKEKLDENAHELIQHAIDGAKRLRTLIEDLLSLSHVRSGDINLHRTDLAEVLEHAVKNLDVRIKETNARISHDTLPFVTGDKSQLIQLFQNLISNALKFCSDKSPEIHVSATRKNNCWQICIQDNGIGFEKEFADKIFQPFKRLHSRESYPGTGIGLAICQRIVQRHGGKIWADSELDKGAKFCFTIADLR